MLALVGAVSSLLLIACANVSNLMLVRSSVRQRDLAVRAALGGSWWRLVRQMLAEAVLLSLLGALAAIGLAPLLIRVLLALAPQNLPRLESIAVDWRVPLFAAAAGLASVVIFGIVLAVRAARPDVMHILRGEGHPASSASGQLLRNTVVIVEVTLSFVLLVGSGLMFRSLYQLQHIDPGYDPHHILTLLLARNWQLSQQAGRVELLSQIQSRLWALAGVENVTASVPFPLAGGSPPPMEVRTQQVSTDLTRIFTVDFHGVLAGYFETLRTPVLAGRSFAEDDIARGRNVAVIDQLLANEAFPNESAGPEAHLLAFWRAAMGRCDRRGCTSANGFPSRARPAGTDLFPGQLRRNRYVAVLGHSDCWQPRSVRGRN